MHVRRVVAEEHREQHDVGREPRDAELGEDAVLGRARPHDAHVEDVQVTPGAGRAEAGLGERHHALGIRDRPERERVADDQHPAAPRRLRLDELLVVEAEGVAPVVVPAAMGRDVRRLPRDELLERGVRNGRPARAARGEHPHARFDGGGDAEHALREHERGENAEHDQAETGNHRQLPAPPGRWT